LGILQRGPIIPSLDHELVGNNRAGLGGRVDAALWTQVKTLGLGM
jgi:hypothetical protein